MALFALAAALGLTAVAMTAATGHEGGDIGAGMAILLAMVVALVATVFTAMEQTAQARRHGGGLGRRVLACIAGGAVVTAVLAAAVGQWPLAVASLIPAVVCGSYAVRDRTA